MRHCKLVLIALSRIVVAGIFWVAVRLFYSIEIRGSRHAKARYPIYFAIQHKRDLDPIVELPSVLFRCGWQALCGRVHFALGGEAFLPGFLARIVRRPRWFARLVGLIPLGEILRGLGAQPLDNVYIRPAEVWIHEWLNLRGNAPAVEVLSLNFLTFVAVQSHEEISKVRMLSLKDLLAWRYRDALHRWQSVDIFVEPARQVLKREMLQRMKRQIQDLLAWLEQGGALLGAPEGQLSPDGRISLAVAAIHRLLREWPERTAIVPISISYDFMTTRRQRIFVSLAAPLYKDPAISIKQLETQLHDTWLLHSCFTCTQLASGFLVEQSRSVETLFTVGELAEYVWRRARELEQQGRYVDRRLLSARRARKLARGFLDFAQTWGFVRKEGEALWSARADNLVMEVPPGEVGYRINPLAYAYNELQDMLGGQGEQAPSGKAVRRARRLQA